MTNEANSKPDFFRLPYLVLVVALLVTVGVTYIFYKSAQDKDVARFKQQAGQIDAGIKSRIKTYIALLKSGRGFVETSENLSHSVFRAYVSNLDLKKNYSGVQGIGFAKRVLSYEVESLNQKMESQGITGFKVFPETSKYDYISIVYLEPLDERNRRAIGFDMSSEPIRRAAMEKARDINEPVATGKVYLVQENEENKQAGFLIYNPVYRGNANPQTVEERRRLLEGYIYSPFRAKDFLDDIEENVANEDIAVTIYDTEINPENILAESHTDKQRLGEFSMKDEISFAGRQWIVEYHSLPEFGSKSSAGWTLTIFVGGLFFSLLLFGITFLETAARERAEKITAELKVSEREKAGLFEKEQEARRRAEDAGRVKDEFISVVSHELRTPLNSIAGWTKILHSEKLSSAMKSQALEKIERNLRLQTRIVEDLLDFTQIFSGKKNLVKKPVEIAAIVNEVYEEAEKMAIDKKIGISKNININGEKVYGDSERLKRAIENVLHNAVKFTPVNGNIEVEISDTGKSLELKIKDSGQGINLKFLPYVFEGFRQADSSSTRQYGGLGLGLAISQNILELHGGKITAQSEGEGKGAVFTISLPKIEKDSLEKV